MANSREVRIGEWTLESSRNRMTGADGTVVLTPLAARVLLYLAEHQNEVVGADELIEQLWQRRMVGDSPVYRIIADLRQALRDDAKAPRYIETVRKRGYRLLAEVEWLDDTRESVATGTSKQTFLQELRRRNVIRIGIAYVAAAWLILQAADLVLDNVAAPAWIMQVFLLAVVAGLPLALLFAWAYELTPNGIRRERDVDYSDLIAQQTSRQLDRVIIIVLGVAVAFLMVDRFFLRTPDQALDSKPAGVAATANSIAVLPFVASGASPDDAYFADGISEVLIHQLAQVSGLKVIARTSSFAFKGINMDVRKIGKQLGVAAVLEGSVQRVNGQLRISVQLIDARFGTHYWSKHFDRTAADIFAIQDEIAQHVVETLPDELLPDQAKSQLTGVGTGNLEAYDEYLKGLEQLRISSVESLPRAIEHFERAVELDDDYNEARLKLIETYNAQNYIFQIDYAELIVRNQTIPREILRRDPNSFRAMSYLAKADFSLHFPTGSGEAERLWTEALSIAPRDPVVLWNYAYYLGWIDRSEEADEMLEQALEVDPFSPRALASAARQGNLQYTERLRDIYSDNPAGWSIAGELHVRQGNLAQAYDDFRIAEEKSPRDPEFPAMAAIVLMTVGLLDEAEKAVQRAESKEPGHSVPVAARIALTYRQQGLDAAGPIALNALRNQLPPRQFSPIVTQSLALRYALRSDRPEQFLDAMSVWRGVPGAGGRKDIRSSQITMPTEFWWKLVTVPAFRAVGETDVAEVILASARNYFNNASETLRYHETDYLLHLLEGNYKTALDTLETIVHSPRGGFMPAYFTDPSELRWWLEFEGELAAPLRDKPRYVAILEERDRVVARDRVEILEIINSQTAAPAP